MVKPVWWKRIGFVLGVTQMFLWARWLVDAGASWSRALLATVILFWVVTAIYSWRQGVEVGADGIRLRRVAKRRRAGWDEIDRFAADPEKGAVALLKDGTMLTLFDWRADVERVVDRLEEARPRHVGAGARASSVTDVERGES